MAHPAHAVDLRSDTVTQPTEEMRRAMAHAEVGDDMYGEDPTVAALEAETAALTGKEAALFVPSGTMGNEIALLCHTTRGDEALLHDAAHILTHECGGPAALAGVTLHPLAGAHGIIAPESLLRALRPDDPHAPLQRLLCLENTHNLGGGAAWPPEQMQRIAALARGARLAVHLDGARIWNAAVALGQPVASLCAPADTVMCCLSKGLCAPVGSLLCGSRELVGRARRFRQMLGGGMRQSGVLAAAGLCAIRGMIPRLAEDHENARHLAGGLDGVPGLRVDPSDVQTNIVLVQVLHKSARVVADDLRTRGVLALPIASHTLRLVTHRDVDRAACDAAIARITQAIAA